MPFLRDKLMINKLYPLHPILDAKKHFYEVLSKAILPVLSNSTNSTKSKSHDKLILRMINVSIAFSFSYNFIILNSCFLTYFCGNLTWWNLKGLAELANYRPLVIFSHFQISKNLQSKHCHFQTFSKLNSTFTFAFITCGCHY